MKHLVLLILTMASVVSMAAPVKSVVGGKEIALGEGGGLSAKSYIQDGLIAMWDGIENAGWGKHDVAPAEWVNLVDENCNARFATYQPNTYVPEVGYNCMVFTKNCFYIKNATRLASAKFIDILFESDAVNNQNNSYLCELATANITFQARGAACLRSGNGVGATIKSLLTKERTWLFSVDFSTLTSSVPYVDGRTSAYNRTGTYGGISQNSFGRGYWGDNYFYGRIFCIRIYNRALTAEEIAHNYEIDKERFNLP